MEFYSERCSDWLEKNNNIHPDKLMMEIHRFEKMISETSNTSEQADAIDDLQLTIQLLQERLSDTRSSQTPSSEISIIDKSPLQPTIQPTTEAWDTASLTHYDKQNVEVLNKATRAQRKADILTIPGVQLGTASLKKKN